MVRVNPITEGMLRTISTDKNWQMHFINIVGSVHPDVNAVVPMIVRACEWLVNKSGTFRRQTLQTRFFETGDNFYLGMEMLREYIRWRKYLVKLLVSQITCDKEELASLKKELSNSIDRLWYENCLETIRSVSPSDTLNGRRTVAPLFSCFSASLALSHQLTNMKLCICTQDWGCV
jgi:hypothetical protein